MQIDWPDAFAKDLSLAIAASDIPLLAKNAEKWCTPALLTGGSPT